MKSQTILIFILCAGLLVSLFWNVDDRETIQSLKLEKEREQVALKHREDSLRSLINRKDEQILKVMRQSSEFEIIARDAVKQAEKDKKRYEAVIFKRFANDSIRSGEIAKLYPSYSPR